MSRPVDAVVQLMRELMSPPAVLVTQAEITAAALEAAIRTAAELARRAHEAVVVDTTGAETRSRVLRPPP